MGTEKSRTDCLKDAESNPILIGDQKVDNSASKKYLEDRINEKGTAASITKTIDNRIPGPDKKINEILAVCEHPCLIGFPTTIGLISEFETKIVLKLLNNCELWLGLNNNHLEKLQEFQNKFHRKVFQVSQSGTPKGMLD